MTYYTIKRPAKGKLAASLFQSVRETSRIRAWRKAFATVDRELFFCDDDREIAWASDAHDAKAWWRPAPSIETIILTGIALGFCVVKVGPLCSDEVKP